MKRWLAFPKQNRLLARIIKSKEKRHNLFSFVKDDANWNVSAFRPLENKQICSLLQDSQHHSLKTARWTTHLLMEYRHHHLGRMLDPKGTPEPLQAFDSQGMNAESGKTRYHTAQVNQCGEWCNVSINWKEKRKVQEGAAMRCHTPTQCLLGAWVDSIPNTPPGKRNCKT